MYQSMYQDLKLGFVGFGKYGYAIMKAILKSGHHDINNVYFEKIDNTVLENLVEDKRTEITNNYGNLENLLERFRDKSSYKISLGEKHSLSTIELIEEISKDGASVGVLIVSLDTNRWEKVCAEIKKSNRINWNKIWILSSISHLGIKEIKDATDEKVKIIRYIPNLATSVGFGIISAYIEPEFVKEGEIILRKVFQGLGKIVLVKDERGIDSARIIAGSTLGIFAYFAKILSDSIEDLGINCLDGKQVDAIEIVYHSIIGMLALCKWEEINSWDDLLKFIYVKSSMAGKRGTTEFIIDELNGKTIPEIINESIKRCHDKYLNISNNPEFEI